MLCIRNRILLAVLGCTGLLGAAAAYGPLTGLMASPHDPSMIQINGTAKTLISGDDPGPAKALAALGAPKDAAALSAQAPAVLGGANQASNVRPSTNHVATASVLSRYADRYRTGQSLDEGEAVHLQSMQTATSPGVAAQHPDAP